MRRGFTHLFSGIFLVSAMSVVAESNPIQFNRDIRPILSDNCFRCHGPDKNARKAKLRLDTESGLFTNTEKSIPVVPGKLDKSEVFRRITTKDPDDLMPPPDSGKKLTQDQITLIKQWIQQGAKWEGHWAYIPPKQTPPPKVKNKKWARNSVDHFILARLESKGLKPSPEADKRVLIRRLSFDLIGIPPTPEEVQAFLSDKSEDAYEKLVDRLLASPRYGERMTMRWLDLVRYADTVGYHGDRPVSIWPYRDYVIKAFNSNMPFDRFTTEQIAGDLLPNATIDQKTASGYNRLNMMTEEGGAQDKEYRAKYFADRVRTTGSVWLGSTLGCAECHDHKFDPFTTKDFYSFGAFFADLKEKGYYQGGLWDPFMELPSEQQTAEMKRFDESIAELKKALETSTPEIDLAQKKWETDTAAKLENEQFIWSTVKPAKMTSKGGAKLTLQEDQSVLLSGKNPEDDIYTLTLHPEQTNITAVRLEALTHSSLANQSLSRGNGNFVLTEFELKVATTNDAKPRAVKIARALADFEQQGHPVALAIDGKKDTGWAVEGHVHKKDRQAVFILTEPFAGGPGSTLIIRLEHESQYKQHNIGRFRLSLTSAKEPSVPSVTLPGNIITLLKLPANERNKEQNAELAKHYRGIAPELDGARKKLAEVQKQKEELQKQITTTLVSVSIEPREIRIKPRGNWMDDSGEIVTPALPQFLSPSKESRRLTRIDLAQWLVSKDNPLTARVMVNRLWKMCFGTGLSKTLDDIGLQGEWPTHPELLDNLALEFMESGWDIKHMVRLLVTSSAYRQSSTGDEKLRELDPFNRLIARQSRFRLDAEMVRDNALATSGLLSSTMYGPSAKPYQPAGYYAQLNFPKREYEADHGDNQYRRGVYMHWQRTFLHPMLLAFDAPSREECTAERPRSNTPLQSLVLLNDPSYVEAARVFAEKIMTQGGANERDRLKWAYQRALSREPNKQELEALMNLRQKHVEKYKADTKAAEELLKTGDSPVQKNLDQAELAAWTSVSRTILNLHETITRF